MGLITESDGARGYETITIPAQPAGPVAVAVAVAGNILRRSSARPTRRAALYLHCARDPFAAEDLVSWFTERGFHFYAADLRPDGDLGLAGGDGRRLTEAECFAGLDAACQYLREAEGIDTIVLTAHSAGALTAALWCDARRDTGPVDALILTCPEFGRRLRHGLEITCPVLVMSPAAKPSAAEGRRRSGLRRGKGKATIRLGPHVTWLRLASGLAGETSLAEVDRRLFFDEMGRWLGAYMYGQVRDQLL